MGETLSDFNRAIATHPRLKELFPVAAVDAGGYDALEFTAEIRRKIDVLFPSLDETQVTRSTVRRKLNRLFEVLRKEHGADFANQILEPITDAVNCPVIAERHGIHFREKGAVNMQLELLVRDMFREKRSPIAIIEEFMRLWRASGYQEGVYGQATFAIMYTDDGRIGLLRI